MHNKRKNKHNKIRFLSSDDFSGATVEKPAPAVSSLPSWFKEMPSSTRAKECPFKEKSDETIKSCLPFLDALSLGYIQTLWTDIYIKDGGLSYKYATGPEPMIHRNYEHEHHLPIPEFYYQQEYAWLMPNIPQTTAGTSCIITHPLNRMDLPFYTLSGVVDTDNDLFVRYGRLPFYIRKGFEGLIPAGTPLFQVIPFVRTKWERESLDINEEERLRREVKIQKHFVGGYKKLYRKPKYWL
jgi:hypothetical protein